FLRLFFPFQQFSLNPINPSSLSPNLQLLSTWQTSILTCFDSLQRIQRFLNHFMMKSKHLPLTPQNQFSHLYTIHSRQQSRTTNLRPNSCTTRSRKNFLTLLIIYDKQRTNFSTLNLHYVFYILKHSVGSVSNWVYLW